MTETRMALGYAPSEDQDAILAYSEHLTGALNDRPGSSASLLLRRGRGRGGWRTAGAATGAPLHEALRKAGAGVLALQYNPFSYGHWGVAPGLLAELFSARRRAALRRLVLLVHEPYVALPGFRYTLMGAVQRSQLAALMRCSDDVLATSQAWLPVLDGVSSGRRVVVLPVGSNVPDRRASRAQARASLGVSDGTLVVSTFGLAHPQQKAGHVADAVAGALEDGHEIVLVGLGRRHDDVDLSHPRLRLVCPGPQDAPDLAALLAATDLFLAPYSDGASTRRGTLMAALQHGLCVVATEGAGRESELRGPALQLAPVSDPAAFAAHARRLAGDAAARERHGLAARELYERRYSWAAIAERFAQEVRLS